MLACLALVCSLINCGINTTMCALKLKCYYEFFKCCGCIGGENDVHHDRVQQVEIVGIQDEFSIEQNPFNIV